MITRPRPALTPAQAAAVEAEGGAFVDAGAGSGKTTVLVERYIRAVTDRNLSPSAVLAVTFTNRAAGEMRERIRARLRHDGRDALIPLVEGGWIGTIHATCRRILAEYPEEAGVTRGLRVADEVETVLLRETAYERALARVVDELGDGAMALVAGYGNGLRDVVEALHDGLRLGGHPLGAPRGSDDPALLEARLVDVRREAEVLAAKEGDGVQVRAQRQAALDLLDLLERGADASDLADLRAYAKGSAAYKDLLAEVETAAADILAAQLHEPLGRMLEAFAEAYRAAKDEAGALDHDDLQLRTRRLLEEHAAIRTALQERFREIMVDEFQDTDGLQTAIIDLLRAPGTPILAVGDEQQAIYGFRGADVEVFRGERARAEGDRRIAVVSLHENRRSVPPVLDAVNALFSREADFAHRPLVPVRAHDGDEPVVELLVGLGEDTASARRVEAALIAQRLHALVAAGACRPGEIAILFQAGTRADAYERALRRVGLPTVASTGRGFLSRQPVEDVMAMLRVLWNRYDDLALLTCLASPMAGVSNDGLALLREAVAYEFADALATVESAGLREDDLARVVGLRDAIERLRPLAGRLPLGDLVAAVIAETRYDLATLVLRDGTERMANLAKLERIARAFEDARGPDLPAFIRAVESGRLDTQVRTDGVTASEDDDAIRLLTVHQAKGLEYPVVVVADAGAKPQVDVPLALVGRDGTPTAAVPASTGNLQPTAGLRALREAKRAAERQEAHRRAYVACTRAENRLIISGVAPNAKPASGSTLHWALALVDDACEPGERVIELDDARIALHVTDVDQTPPATPEPVDETIEFTLDAGAPQLQMDVDAAMTANGSAHAGLPALAPLPTADAWVAPALSYSALDSFERCPYRFQLQRMLGLPVDEAGGSAPVGKAVHAAVETGGDAGDLLLAAKPDAEPGQVEEARGAIDRWRRSPLAARFEGLDGVRHEQPFLLAGGTTVITGFFDLCALDGDTLVIGDLKVGALKELSPDERRDTGYAIQEAVYALAALEAGHPAVEVAFQWVGDDAAATAMATRRFTAADAPRLRADLEARVAAALAGPWPARPAETTCAGCPALGALCAGTGRR